MSNPVTLFAIATLLPVPLLVAGGLLGGVWLAGALFYMTIFVFLLDELIHTIGKAATPEAEFPLADRLSALLAQAHFPLLLLAIAAVSGATGLNLAERVAGFFAFGLFFGQVSNSNAHELIHRARRPLFELGKWVYVSLLFGHHTSAHRLVHHRYAASNRDPNSARAGETYYRFVVRAWFGSFRAGLTEENSLRARKGGATGGLHPYLVYCGGALAAVAISTLAFGVAGLFAHVGLALFATGQLLMSDYVQHYGLCRRVMADGRPEPVGPQHSWNAPHWYSSLLMLNAPRHSDHHSHPARPYPALVLEENYPTLPRSLPVMGFVALYPPRWRRLMDRRAAEITGRGAG